MGEPGGALVVKVGKRALGEFGGVRGIDGNAELPAGGGRTWGDEARPRDVRRGRECENIRARPLGRIEPALAKYNDP